MYLDSKIWLDYKPSIIAACTLLLTLQNTAISESVKNQIDAINLSNIAPNHFINKMAIKTSSAFPDFLKKSLVYWEEKMTRQTLIQGEELISCLKLCCKALIKK